VADQGPGGRLILWDVDGTLVSAGPVARDAFDAAIEHVLGWAPGDHGVHMSGKTDPQIALEILANLAIAHDEARRHLPRVMQELERELEEAVEVMRASGRELPGARRMLERLAAEPGVAQTVLSGNLAANARLKLAAFGLEALVDWEIGAYGSDDEDRTKLVPIALRRAAEIRGLRFEPRQCWVIGDTPRDLECARAGGARCLLLGTGRYELSRLADLGADVVLSDLTDTDAVVRILLG
jgi:phosphoglycolate phosphatase-like HAD superfamily hydrolase